MTDISLWPPPRRYHYQPSDSARDRPYSDVNGYIVFEPPVSYQIGNCIADEGEAYCQTKLWYFYIGHRVLTIGLCYETISENRRTAYSLEFSYVKNNFGSAEEGQPPPAAK